MEKHEKLLVDKVISLLKENSEIFTARWFDKKTLEKSIRSIDGVILIMSWGEIVSPISVKMSYKQRRLVRSLIKPIFERDGAELVNELLNKY